MNIFIVSSLGILLTLASYPINLFFLNILAFSGLLFFIEKSASKKRHFLYGYGFGFCYFFTSLYWIPLPILNFFNIGLLIIPMMLLVPLILAFFIGFLSLVTGFFNSNKIFMAISFSCLWVLIEYLRSNIIFPFPWGLLGYSATSIMPLLQFASIVGISGLSFFVALVSSAIFTRSFKYILAIGLMFCSVYIYGYFRLENSKNLVEGSEKREMIRIIQPNVKEERFDSINPQTQIYHKLLKLSNRYGIKNIDYIIWPEASLPIPVVIDDSIKSLLNEIKRKENSKIIIGADRIEKEKNDRYKQYNSLLVVNSFGEIISVYDKKILVPFGEYIPLNKVFPFIRKIAHSFKLGDFDVGDIDSSIKLDKKNHILVSICSESIFDMSYYEKLDYNNLFMLNITNDVWFRDSLEPYQHFNMSRVRAVEYGIPLVIAANTGISGVIDSFGRVLVKTDLNKEIIVDYNLPQKLASPTLYYKVNKLIIPSIIVIFLLVSAVYKTPYFMRKYI